MGYMNNCLDEKTIKLSFWLSIFIGIITLLVLFQVGSKDLDFVVMAIATTISMTYHFDNKKSLMCGRVNGEHLMKAFALSLVSPAAIHLLFNYILN